ncbi:pancreatic triacylglycerol lipase-like isoform X2 [Ranitomeya imitator]|uniref:pancreatic triacylglycerol lipase-like isoform X2 n=1 Tax=Ranitomeya imitator TaxID=111125 RepID=UPI0037E971F5
MIGVSLVIVLLVAAVKGGEVCYSRIGCFTDNVPWAGTVERPISQLPWSPDKINVRFLLFTTSNPSNFQEVNAVNPSTISASNFRTSRKTRFIIHGFVDKGEESWLMDMCKLMLKIEDVNCFCIDWSGGSRTLYTQAANNIRVVGAEVAYFIDILSSNFGYSPANVHVIGHSLGAHAAGEVGKRRKGIARITGLDPAEPYFQGTPVEVRLDPSDAAFVDAIHTDAAPIIPNVGFGMSQLVGHVDFFPNGGEEMPGCKKNALSQIVDIDGIWQGWRYKVTIEVVGSLNVQGFFHVSLFGPNGNTRQYQIYSGYINTGSSYTGYIDVETDVGKLNKVKFIWNNNVINPLFPTIGASSATVQYGKDGVTYRFCGSGTVREEVLQTLNPC